MEDMN